MTHTLTRGSSTVALALLALTGCLPLPEPTAPHATLPAVWPLQVEVRDPQTGPVNAALITVLESPGTRSSTDAAGVSTVLVDEGGHTVCAEREGYIKACEAVTVTHPAALVITFVVEVTEAQQTDAAPSASGADSAIAGLVPRPIAPIWDIRADFDGAEMQFATELPGWPPPVRRYFYAHALKKGYTALVICVLSGASAPAPGELYDPGWPMAWRGTRRPYDGIADFETTLKPTLEEAAALGFTVWLVPHQGPDSMPLLAKYSNEWARDGAFAAWARRVSAVLPGRVGWLHGFELGKSYPAFDGNPDHRGPKEWLGYASIAWWAREWKRGTDGAPFLYHDLPEKFGPLGPEDGGRLWTEATWWRDYGHDVDGVAVQFQIDGARRPRSYYAAVLDRARRLAGASKRVACGEYVRPGFSFPHTENVGPWVAREIATWCRELGADGFMNGN